MKLSDVIGALAEEETPFELSGDPDIADVVMHTDAVTPGAIFCCIPGAHVDGHELARDAIERGAVALLVERPLDLGVAEVRVASSREAIGPMAARFHGDPSRSLTVLGVTGTNGKTTTVSMLRSILSVAGRRTEVIGTLASLAGGPVTTPDAPQLQAQLAAWRDAGVEVVAMEVSSHALAMGRVNGTWFSVAGFTTLGHDHLDLHGDIESYFAAKARLFEAHRTARAVVRTDDPWGARLRDLIEPTGVAVRPYTLSDAVDAEITPTGTRFGLRGVTVELPVPGAHNVANALCSAAMADWIGVSPSQVAAGLAALGTVPGRFERVDLGQGFTVAVDYAHTPDALQTVLTAARRQADAAGGRVIVVFGCGGDKDRQKRPIMGRIASELADLTVITSDNPRSEDPRTIIDEVLGGVVPTADVVTRADRAEAIHHALRAARDHDVVIVAGKGHETTQVIGDTVVPFDDRVVVTDALRERGAP